MGTRQNEVLVAELRPFASYGWMTTLKIHTKSALFGAGLVVLVGVLSAQAINNRFVAVRVLETPVIKTEADWPPRVENLFCETFSYPGGTQWQTYDVYTVPGDKWLVVQSVVMRGTGAVANDTSRLRYIRPTDPTYVDIPPALHFRGVGGSEMFDHSHGPNGKALPPGTILAIMNPYGEPEVDVLGYLVDA